MKVIKVDQNTEAWMELRKAKITGSKLKDIVVKRGTNRKDGFYRLVADRLAIDPDGTNPMDRGHDLEEEALSAFEDSIGLKLERNCGMWVRDENENIAISPDSCIKNDDGVIVAGVEVKCLASHHHIRAIVENEVPSDYEMQILQYFIVNDDLETVYMVFYDPRVQSKPMHYLTISRESVEGDITSFKAYQANVLAEVDKIVIELAF